MLNLVENRKMEVMKHSAAVHITNKVTMLQKRAWNILLHKAFNLLEKQDLYRISLSEFCRILKFDIKNLQYLKDFLTEMTNLKVKWNIFGKDKTKDWGVAVLLSEVRICDGLIEYGYTPTIRKNLNNPNMYAKIDLLMQNEFDSKFAEFVWELCVDVFDVKRNYGETIWIPLNQFKAYLGLGENEYSLFKEFNRSIIKPTKREINKKTKLCIEIKLKKEGRKVAFIKIEVRPGGKDIIDIKPFETSTPKKVDEFIQKIGKTIPPTSTTKPRQKITQQQTPMPQTAENGPLASLLQLIPEDQRRFITASRLITASYKRYGYEYTKANALYTSKHSKKGYCGYLRLALTNNYAGYQVQSKPAPKQSTTKAPPKPKPPEKWPMIDYLGQIVDLSIFQHTKEGYSTIVAFDEKTDVLTAFQLYRMYKIDDPKIKVLKKMPDLMPQTERLPTVKYKGYTVDLEEHRYIIGNGTIVVGKDLNKRGLNYASLLRLYRKGEVEVIDEYETNHTQETGEESVDSLPTE